MDTFKLLKLKYYFWNMVIGVSALLLSAGIGQSIVLEVFKEYDPASLIAYICGGIACGCIFLYGFYGVARAFRFEKKILKSLDEDEREHFFSELEEHVELSISGHVVITSDYLLLSVKDSIFARVLPKENLIGCFRIDVHQEAEATESEMLIYDQHFKAIGVNIRGKGSTQAMNRLYEYLCKQMPWIYHEDYDDFLSKTRKIGYRRKLLKQMKDLKMRYETGYDSDIEAENEMLAMSRDVKEKLNSHSLLEKFLTKSK
ncbi:MAG: hypothetical protein II251_07705 [Lachnospiraceae bacterium]|nr:hypothetical protein [Lachnospiraceae bacterium]